MLIFYYLVLSTCSIDILREIEMHSTAERIEHEARFSKRRLSHGSERESNSNTNGCFGRCCTRRKHTHKSNQPQILTALQSSKATVEEKTKIVHQENTESQQSIIIEDENEIVDDQNNRFPEVQVLINLIIRHSYYLNRCKDP